MAADMRTCLRYSFLSAGLLLLAATAHAQTAAAPANPTATLPSATDQRIKSFDDPHMSWLPEGPARNQLLVFLPGTGGKPRSQFPFANTAAELGYHVIFLMYPDDLAAQAACGKSKEPEAHPQFRLALIRGGQLNPKRHIERAESIENRLIQLLKYLSAKQPAAHWGQFLDGKTQPEWSKLAVAGHSQGGGHAFVIGKFHEVARVIMFGSPKDYSFYFKRPATGFDTNTKTPITRFFAFNHVRDNGNGCNHDQQREIFKQMGLLKLGVLDVDKANLDAEHAHVLYTDVDIQGARFHGSVLNENLPVRARVWKYMLTEPAP